MGLGDTLHPGLLPRDSDVRRLRRDIQSGAIGPDGVTFNDDEGPPEDVDESEADAGTSEYAARRDHKHYLGGHHATHESAGSDAIKLDDLAEPDDNTDLNATTARHGLLPKLAGGTTKFFCADGTWRAVGMSVGIIRGHYSDTQWYVRRYLTAAPSDSGGNYEDIIAESAQGYTSGLPTGSDKSAKVAFVVLVRADDGNWCFIYPTWKT